MYIYFRIFGYTATIVMHLVNIYAMAAVLDSKLARDLFKDPTIKFFNDMQARYFTCWTFFLQIIYAIVGLMCDVLTLKNSENESYRLPKHLKGLRDTLFAAIQWPSTLLVSTMFWGLFHIDRELILPPVLDRVLTRTSNHIIHSAIIPVVLWELIFRPRKEPRSHWRNIAHIMLHYTLYFSVLFYTYYSEGRWIYPVFEKTAGTIYFPMFMMAVLVLLLTFYYIQWPLNKFIHGNLIKDTYKIL